MAIADRNFVIYKLNELSTIAKKNFGQNFLINDDISQKIVDALEIQDNETLIEIGPGLGALTFNLVKYHNPIDLYEIDSVMVDHLTKYFAFCSNVHVYKKDFLKVNLNEYEGTVRIIGNLPYYITTPLLEKIIATSCNMKRCVLMVQKEVYARVIAKPNTDAYGPLAILIAYAGQPSMICSVPHGNFYPSPHVDSLVFAIDMRDDLDREKMLKLYTLVNQLFLMRRKTIMNNLISVTKNRSVAEAILTNLNIDFTRRPETISVDEYVSILNALTK